MAPQTRSAARATPPPYQSKSTEADTVKKTRFFNVFDKRQSTESIRSIAALFSIDHHTACRWLKQRDILGSPAYRRTRKTSLRLGRKPKLSEETCKMLVSLSKNPVRDQLFEAQIEHHNLDVSVRTLQRSLKRDTNRGQRYKQAYIQKQISKKNRALRVSYGQEHLGKSIDNFWQYIFFTDEAHIDPSSNSQGYILREQGTRYDTENIQERGEKKGVRLHIAGWINWYRKAEKLEFYNDENDYIQQLKRPPKPRKTMYESAEDFQHRLDIWDASLPHQQEIKPKGNAMTQKYYCERLLPVYIKAVNKARLQYTKDWLLQEDNDPSHGSRKEGLAQRLKRDSWVNTLIHPLQSPDLNPMEGIWNILKQRIRRHTWRSIEELKEIIQYEWSRITMKEVRARISEMPGRCKLLVNSGGGPIRSHLW